MTLNGFKQKCFLLEMRNISQLLTSFGSLFYPTSIFCYMNGFMSLQRSRVLKSKDLFNHTIIHIFIKHLLLLEKSVGPVSLTSKNGVLMTYIENEFSKSEWFLLS